MIEALDACERFSRGRTREDLGSDQMFQLALVRAIEILGEAASKVSIETRQAHPRVPWGNIIGMRNRLVHAYFDVNLDILWETATRDVPFLLQMLRSLPLESTNV